VRPFSERQPVMGWLALDCGIPARVGILGRGLHSFPFQLDLSSSVLRTIEHDS